MPRTLPFVVLLAVAMALVSPSGAPARVLARSSPPVAGPALSGERVTWIARGRLMTADATGARPPRTLLTLHDQDPAQWPWLFDAAAGVVGWVHAHVLPATSRYDTDEVLSETLTVGPIRGPATTLRPCVEPFVADGVRLAYVDADCQTIVVRDLRTGRERARVPITGGPRERPPYAYGTLWPLRLAGEHLIWGLPTDAGSTARTVMHVVLSTGMTTTMRWDGARSAVLAPDGTLARLEDAPYDEHRLTTARVVITAPDGIDDVVATWLSQRISDETLLGFTGRAVVLRRTHSAMRSDGRTYDEVLAVRPDGTVRPLVRTPRAWSAGPGQALLSVAVDGGRLAWTARACGVVTVETARIADLPAGGRELRAPRRCARPRSR